MIVRRKCMFHIGLPKTGSSSIQAFLRRRPAELLEHGIRFPIPTSEFGRTGSESRIPQHDLLQYFYNLARPEEPWFIDYDEVIALSRRDPPGSTLLLTHEVQALHGQNAKKPVFADLARTHDIEFLCYLRHPLSWLASFYEQAMSQPNHFIFGPARHFATRGYLEKGFRGMLAPFHDLGTVELHDYDSARSGGRLVPDFMRRLGAGAFVHEASVAPRVNAHAYSPEQLTIMRTLKSQGTEAEVFLRVRDIFDLFNTTSRRKRGPVVLFPTDLRDSIEREWIKDRDALGNALTLTGTAPALDPAPYRDDPELLAALVDFSAATGDAAAAAVIEGAVTGASLQQA